MMLPRWTGYSVWVPIVLIGLIVLITAALAAGLTQRAAGGEAVKQGLRTEMDRYLSLKANGYITRYLEVHVIESKKTGELIVVSSNAYGVTSQRLGGGTSIRKEGDN